MSSCLESIFEVIFFKKNYEVICIINLKNKLFKGFTRGDPWVTSLVKQNLNRTQKYKMIALKKNQKDILRTLQGGALYGLSHEAKFNQDVKTRSKHNGVVPYIAIYGMGRLIRT